MGQTKLKVTGLSFLCKKLPKVNNFKIKKINLRKSLGNRTVF